MENQFGLWWAVAIWIVLYGIMILFVPFYKKSQRRPASVYIAFIVAFALEMFGVPFSMFFIGAVFGVSLPEGVLWGHTLVNYIGYLGMYLGAAVTLIGIVLVVLGWRAVYRNYWGREKGRGKLVTQGIYAYIRHPQYTGFFLVTLGILLEWATIPLLIMWPILLILYYRLARKEEKDMEEEFGSQYAEYKNRTSMFIPLPGRRRGSKILVKGVGGGNI